MQVSRFLPPSRAPHGLARRQPILRDQSSESQPRGIAASQVALPECFNVVGREGGYFAIVAPFLGYWVEQYESITWAEELIEPAKAVGHRRLAQLYTMAVHRYLTGGVKETARYIEAARAAIDSVRFDEIRDWLDSIGTGYLTMGQLERSMEWCRSVIARRPGTHYSTRLCLALALTSAGEFDAAMATAQDLLTTAGAADNPHLVCSALLAFGWAYRDADPAGALDALRRGLQIAQDSGNRQMESAIAVMLSRLVARDGEPTDACDYLTLSLRHYFDSGCFKMMRTPLAILAVFLDRLGRYESAATISEFAASPLARASIAEFSTTIAHLRGVLGAETYAYFADAGANMTNAAMAAYAFEQIDQARAQLPPADLGHPRAN